MGWAMVLIPVALTLAGLPLFVVLLATVILVMIFFVNVPLTAVHQVIFSSLDKYALIAVPFFVFAGDLLGRGGVSSRLVRWVQSIIGRVRGSLPFTSLGTAVVFSSISGSTAATVAAVGGLTYKRLREAGYSEKFSAGLLIAAGAIDNLIPPSIGFILYGIMSDTSIVKLFAAGFIPGFVLALFYAIVVYRHARLEGDKGGPPFSLREFGAATRDGIWAIVAPVAVLGGIYAGIFSPTEAAAVACVYAILVSRFVYREASAREIFDSAARSMYLSAQIFIILAGAGLYSWLLTVSGASAALTSSVLELNLAPWAMLLAVNILLLAIGTVFDPPAAILILTPLFNPIVKVLGIDPVHFGVVVIMNLSIGTFSPPFGVNIFVGQAVFKASIRNIYAGVWPFMIAAIGALLIVTYVPALSLWILKYV
jgi:C4-dicarboxylate transporter DctM subunit